MSCIKLSSPAAREFWEIPVLFEDDYLLALDKPGGLLTSPDRYDPQRPNLMKLLHTAIAAGKPWARERGLNYLMNAHRLDFETSGVILLAKGKPALMTLANLFGSEKPLKQYVALVQGTPAEEKFEVDAGLAPHPARTGLMRVDPKTASARGHFLKCWKNSPAGRCSAASRSPAAPTRFASTCATPVCLSSAMNVTAANRSGFRV